MGWLGYVRTGISGYDLYLIENMGNSTKNKYYITTVVMSVSVSSWLYILELLVI